MQIGKALKKILMMLYMAKIKINSYKIGLTDQFFFDTNVWLLLFSTISNFQLNDQKQYSKFLNDLLIRKGTVFITSMILSEFSNVILKNNFKIWCDKNKSKIPNPNFKRDYIPTQDYKKSVNTIQILINKILKLPVTQVVGDNFNSLNIDSVFDNFKHVDFNDSYILELSKTNNYKIITNDTDFLKIATQVDIISAKV